MTEPTTPATDQAGEPSGDGGQQQAAYTPPASQADLDRIIADRVARTKAQFKDYGDLKAKAAELDQFKAANQTAEQKAAEDLARWQSESQRWQQVAVGSRIQALAADFADPTDAVSALPELSKYLGSGGEIDDEAIRTDLADVLNRKPHWRKPDGAPTPPRLPAPNLAQGSGGGRPAADPASEFAAIIQGQLNRP